MSIQKDSQYKLGWKVKPSFKISLHIKDLALLELFKEYFGAGVVGAYGLKATFEAFSIKDLEKIIKHFKTYPLKSQKAADFILFENAYALILLKRHLEKSGLAKLVAIRASMNLGLPEVLKNAFPNIRAAKRTTVDLGKIEQAQWMAGFASGEGCFYININKIKSTVEINFNLCQHVRDERLLRRCIEFFQAGRVTKSRNCYVFWISKFEVLFNKVLPLFKEAPIMGIKAKDFKD